MPGVFNTIDNFSKRLVHSILDRKDEWPRWLPIFGGAMGYTTGLHFSRLYCKDPNTKIMLTGTPDDILHLADGSYL
jgi:hypothetical protein